MIIKEIDSKLINRVHSELNKNGFIHLKKNKTYLCLKVFKNFKTNI